MALSLSDDCREGGQAARAIFVFVSLGVYSLLKFFGLTFLSRKVSLRI